MWGINELIISLFLTRLTHLKCGFSCFGDVLEVFNHHRSFRMGWGVPLGGHLWISTMTGAVSDHVGKCQFTMQEVDIDMYPPEIKRGNWKILKNGGVINGKIL